MITFLGNRPEPSLSSSLCINFAAFSYIAEPARLVPEQEEVLWL